MSWIARLRNVFRGERLDEELDDELRYHLEQKKQALIEEGLAAKDAEREARRRFGNMAYLKEESRGWRLLPWLESAVQDLRYGVRGLGRNPAVSAAAVLSLALATGATIAIFSIVDALLLRSLPVRDPQQLVCLTTPIDDPAANKAGVFESDTFNYPLFEQLRDAGLPAVRLFGVSYDRRKDAYLPGASLPEKVVMQYISGNAFEILGVGAVLGRTFTRDDDLNIGGHPVAVLSEEYWTRRLGRDPHVLDKTIRLEKEVFQVVGVAQRGFFGVEVGTMADVWVPMMMFDRRGLTNAGWGWFRVLGRLGDGVPAVAAGQRLAPVFHEHRVERSKLIPPGQPETLRRFVETPLHLTPAATGASEMRRDFTRPILIVFALVAAVLLIACANVAGLLLARASTRAREMAMRISLGAGRLRLVRQLLTESLVLSALAAALGLALARVAAPALVRFHSPTDLPVRLLLETDGRLVLFCAALTLAVTALFGLAPAFHAARTAPASLLKETAPAPGRLRLGRIFVGLQVAFSFVLVGAAVLFLFTLRNLLTHDPGFDPRNLLIVSVQAPEIEKQQETMNQLWQGLHGRVRALPGVQSASMAGWPIFSRNYWTEDIHIPGRSTDGTSEMFLDVAPEYFDTMRISMLAGRDFAPRDGTAIKPTVCVVNEAFARKYYAGEDPVGRRFFTIEQKGEKPLEIVGLVRSVSYDSLRQAAPPMVYVPMTRANAPALLIRTTQDIPVIADLVRRECAALSSSLKMIEISPQSTLVNNSLVRERLLANLAGAFGALGLVLASIGLYGLLSYSVVRRTREIGIRMAMGARQGEVAGRVLHEHLATVGCGLVLGLAATLWLGQFLESLLFGLRPADPAALGLAVVLFLAVAAAAAWFPARRAARVDPMIALRHE